MFHDRTYSLLGAAPHSEPDLATTNLSPTVREWYSRLGMVPVSGSALKPGHLPASLCEWYAFPGAIAVASRQNRLRPMNELEVVEDEGRQLLLFMDENQGVCRWAIPLNGRDDPQVLVSVEKGPFLPYANTFSDHIFCAVWDWLNDSPYMAGAQADPLLPQDLATLGSRLQGLTTTWNWPGAENYRFATAGLRLILWSAPRQCDWYLFAACEEAFVRAARLVLPLSNLRQSLYGIDENSTSLLEQLQTRA